MASQPRIRVARPTAPPRAPATRSLRLGAANDNRSPRARRVAAALLTAGLAALLLAAASRSVHWGG